MGFNYLTINPDDTIAAVSATPPAILQPGQRVVNEHRAQASPTVGWRYFNGNPAPGSPAPLGAYVLDVLPKRW